MYNFKTKNLKYNMHNLICIASARVIASIDQFDLVSIPSPRAVHAINIVKKENQRINTHSL